MSNEIIFRSPEHKKLVLQLIKARREADLDQKEVAKLLGKSQSFISKIEAGHSYLDVIDFFKLTKIYKKKMSFYFKSL